MQKVYSLKEPATQIKTSCEPQTSVQPQQPELWFNPRTNRWISKSCRVYREILRDRALVEKGLQPGAKPKTKKELAHAAPAAHFVKSKPQAQPQARSGRSEAELPDEDSEDEVWNTTQNYEQTYEPPTEQELAIVRRDALFAKYRM